MRWIWIDRIVGHEPGSRLVAVKCVSRAEDCLQAANGGHGANGSRGVDATPTVMPASLMIEGMAQTAGILVGSVSRFREKVVLAKITSARIDTDVVPGEVIRYDARIERLTAAGASTAGTIERLRPGLDPGEAAATGGWQTIGSVELVFSHLDHNLGGIEFPAHNFVFSENFRGLLEASGLGGLVGEEEPGG